MRFKPPPLKTVSVNNILIETIFIEIFVDEIFNNFLVTIIPISFV